MKLLASLALLSLPVFTQAYTVFETDISQPYEIVPIESTPLIQNSYLGTLEDYPIMYEVTSEESFIFEAQVAQRAGVDMQPLSLLLIRKNDRGGGVSEVVRMTADPAEWTRATDSKLGMTLATSPLVSESVEPGTYRIEVSSPDNEGMFLLTVGQEATEPGYFAELGAIRQTQAYFGLGFFSMLKSSYVYYPIGILLLLFAIYKTWSYRHLIRRDAA
jgi:hypothetical protein